MASLKKLRVSYLRNKTSLKLVIVSTLLFAPTASLLAGVLFGPGLGWSVFSFKPKDNEKTPNYFGFSPHLSFGYSFAQTVDVAFFGNYIPGSYAHAKMGEEEAYLYHLGGEIGSAFAQSIKIKLKGAQQSYRYLSKPREGYVPGFWRGPAFGGSFLILVAQDRETFFETGIEIMSSQLKQENDSTHSVRSILSFSVIINYVLNDFKPSFIETRIFKGII